MSKKNSWFSIIGLYAGLGVLVAAVMIWLYRSCEYFHSLFLDKITPPGAVAAEADAAKIAEEARVATEHAANLSFGILVFILLLQVFAFVTAILVFRNLSRCGDPIRIRMKRLDSAELFLDLPLYFGLFGTVSSFVIMSLNPQVSRLIAYSSTLVGILFSVILRLTLQYPIRQRFISELPADAAEKGASK